MICPVRQTNCSRSANSVATVFLYEPNAVCTKLLLVMSANLFGFNCHIIYYLLCFLISFAPQLIVIYLLFTCQFFYVQGYFFSMYLLYMLSKLLFPFRDEQNDINNP